jgi:hypothetical protein
MKKAGVLTSYQKNVAVVTPAIFFPSKIRKAPRNLLF